MIKKYTEGDEYIIFRAIAETNTHWYDRQGVTYKKDFAGNPSHEDIKEFLDTEKDFETEIVSIGKKK